MILVFKRLESSWHSFDKTVNNIYKHHENALEKISKYEVAKANKNSIAKEEIVAAALDGTSLSVDDVADDLDNVILERFTLGKKNPVSLADIDAAGRIDRIGSPNMEIQTINFWPAKNIDDHINLKERVEKRMVVMQFGGAEVIKDFTAEFEEMAYNQDLENRQNSAMMKQMEITLEEIDGEGSLGLDDFSFDNYRQELQVFLNQKSKRWKRCRKRFFRAWRRKIQRFKRV